MKRRRLFRLASDRRGAAVIELALVAPVMALMVIGIVDISNAFSHKLALEQGVQRAIERIEQTTADTTVEFALPVLIVLIWIFVQLAQVYRAMAGIQQALGEGARYATLCLNPTAAGCSTPSADQVKTKVNDSVYGIGPGTFTVPTPTSGTD